ncbi:MAG: hypothetical protein HYX34_06290 [Actinobacteria bacterium]|nr:hypothetical protein [Actinomycetota bacterium]
MTGRLDTDDLSAGAPATRPRIDPETIRDPPPESLFTARRVLLTTVILAALALLVWAWSSNGQQDPSLGASGSGVVVRYDPAPGSRVLRQAQVGVDLKEGYDGRLVVNGVPIPEEQMVGAIVPGTPAYEQLTPAEQAAGPRPNNRNVVKFQPGPGKAITRFTTGEVQVTIRYWREDQGPRTARSFTYTIFVT